MIEPTGAGHPASVIDTLQTVPFFRDMSNVGRASDEQAVVYSLDQIPQPGKPVRLENSGLGQWACGWIFSSEDIFDRDTLLDLLGYVHPIRRLKGIFRCTDGWWLINRVDSVTSFESSSYRTDSRLEIIKNQPTSGWPEFEWKLWEYRSRDEIR